MPKEPEHKDSKKQPTEKLLRPKREELTRPKKIEMDKETKEFSKLLKEREKDNHVDESIKEIYGDEGALVKVDKNGKTKEKEEIKPHIVSRQKVDPWRQLSLMFTAILLVVAAISWILFFIFNSGSRLNNKDVEFELVGPDTLIIGEEVVYEIKYRNLSEFNLRDVEINVMYPENFIFLDSVPEVNKSNNVWMLDEISTSRSGRIQIKGKIIDKVDNEQDFTAIMYYRPENFSSTFSSDTKLATKITSTGVNTNIEFPSLFNVEQPSEIKINYIQEKESHIDSFRILIEHSEDFLLEDKDSGGVWDISKLTDKQEDFVINGEYDKKPVEDEKIIIKLARQEQGMNSEGKAEEKYYVFYEQEFSPLVAEGALSLTLSVNGSLSNKPVNINDTLNYVVHYKNNSDATLNNVIVMAVINSESVDWKTLSDSNKGEIKGNTIIWTKDEVSGLKSIVPNKEDSFGFSLKLKSEEDLKKIASSKLQIVSALFYSVDSAVKSDDYAVQIINKINSDLKFNSELRYFDRDGMATGDGPLPPKVGEKTTYRTYWTLTNAWHDLENIAVSTVLPNYVQWENNYSSLNGTVSYNTDTRQISWKIDSLDALGEPAMLDFSLSITPNDVDKNKILTVLNVSKTQAKDKSTGGIIIVDSKAKTTNLDDDDVGKGYGKVE